MTPKRDGLSRLVDSIGMINRRKAKTRRAVLARRPCVAVYGVKLTVHCSRVGCAGCVFAGVPREKLR